MKDEAFHETIAAKFKKRFGSDPSKNVVHANPIIWTERGGSVAAPFPKQYLVIIALEDLDQNNGMPLITNGTLACGEYIVLSGEDTLQFNNKGGGLAFFVILSL